MNPARMIAIVALPMALVSMTTIGHATDQAPPARRDRPRTFAEAVVRPPNPGPPITLSDEAAAPLPLPEASLEEPFGIGEALYDPSRTADAVVSLLAKMGIGIVPDGAPSTPATPTLRLDQSEVRALVALADDDLAGADDIENLPYGLADLHAAVSGLRPDLTVDALIDGYARAYESNPESLVAKVLMGQPITPETRLTRAHLWLLLMDGFAAPGGNASWGTADRELPDLPSPTPQWTPAEWKEVLARLPLVTADRLLAVEAPVSIAQGGPPATVTARLRPTMPPLVSRITGKTLAAAARGSLAGQSITWDIAEDAVLREIGELSTPTGEPQTIGADGIARLAYRPAADPTKGQGTPMEEWNAIDAALEARPLVASAYTLPAAAAPLVLGTTHLHSRVRARWRSAETIYVDIDNIYENVEVQLPVFGRATRAGSDSVKGYLSKRADGTYRGTVDATVFSTLTAATCTNSIIAATQRLQVIGRPDDTPTSSGPARRAAQAAGRTAVDIGAAHTLTNYAWLEGGKETRTFLQDFPDAFYALEFFPVTLPRSAAGANAFDRCQPMLPAAREQRRFGASDFAPFNDARWTTPNGGYVIGLRSARAASFVERTLASTPSSDPTRVEVAKDDVPGVFRAFGRGRSEWVVHVWRSVSP